MIVYWIGKLIPKIIEVLLHILMNGVKPSASVLSSKNGQDLRPSESTQTSESRKTQPVDSINISFLSPHIIKKQ